MLRRGKLGDLAYAPDFYEPTSAGTKALLNPVGAALAYSQKQYTSAAAPQPVPSEVAKLQLQASQSSFQKMETYAPPPACTLGPPIRVPLDLLQKTGVEILGASQEDLGRVVSAMSEGHKSQVGSVLADYRAKYPYAPLPTMYGGYIQRGTLYDPAIWLLATGGDPKLLAYPVIPEGTDWAAVFNASLRIFFPDLVFSTGCMTKDCLRESELAVQTYIKAFGPGTDMRKPDASSIVGVQPFPYWEKFVTEEMIQYAVDYITKFPDPFGAPAVAGELKKSGKQYAASIVGKGLGAGLKAASTFKAGLVAKAVASGIPAAKAAAAAGAAAGPYGIAIGVAVAAAIAISIAFAKIFGSPACPPKCPPTPEWLTALLKMKVLREGGDLALAKGSGDKWIGLPVAYAGYVPPTGGKPSLTSTMYGGGFEKRHQCTRIGIRATGTYDLFEAYDELLNRLGGAKKFPWWLVALGVGAVAVS